MHIDSEVTSATAQLAFVPPPWPQARLCLMIANKQRMHCRHPRIGDGILSEKGHSWLQNVQLLRHVKSSLSPAI